MTRAPQGLVAHGRLEASTPTECVRCLTPYGQALGVEFDDLFVYPPSKASEGLLAVPETGILDLGPLAREYFVLDFPIRPLCRPNCRGLCPDCGANWNETACPHAQARPDPRLAALPASETDG